MIPDPARAPSRRAARALAALAALGFVVLPATAPRSATARAPLRLVTGGGGPGMQAQRPEWAPGRTPRLVHEWTDRDRATRLRVVKVVGDRTEAELVPAAGSSRVDRLGGAASADTGAAWFDERVFYFVRSAGGVGRIHFHDGVPREGPAVAGRVSEIALDPKLGRLFAGIEDGKGFDLVRLAGTYRQALAERLTASRKEVEHGFALSPDGSRVAFVASSRSASRLGVVKALGGEWTVPAAVRDGLKGYQVLSLAWLPTEPALLVYARARDGTCALLEVPAGPAAAAVKVLDRRVFVPPGIAPRPALSGGGRFVYYVAADAAARNPVLRHDREGSRSEPVPLPTHGHQEVAVADYPGPRGNPVPWLAAVAVSDPVGGEASNHLYIGPLQTWTGWNPG